MVSMEERESASYKEKYIFLHLYDRITAAQESLAFEAKEKEIQSALTDAIPCSVAQPLERGYKNYYFIIQGEISWTTS